MPPNQPGKLHYEASFEISPRARLFLTEHDVTLPAAGKRGQRTTACLQLVGARGGAAPVLGANGASTGARAAAAGETDVQYLCFDEAEEAAAWRQQIEELQAGWREEGGSAPSTDPQTLLLSEKAVPRLLRSLCSDGGGGAAVVSSDAADAAGEDGAALLRANVEALQGSSAGRQELARHLGAMVALRARGPQSPLPRPLARAKLSGLWSSSKPSALVPVIWCREPCAYACVEWWWGASSLERVCLLQAGRTSRASCSSGSRNSRACAAWWRSRSITATRAAARMT